MVCNNFYSSENLHCQKIHKYTNGKSRQAQVEKRAVTDRHQDTCLQVISFTYGFQRQKLISQRFSYQHFPALPAANLIFSFCMASSKQCLFSLWGYLRGLTPPTSRTSCSALSWAKMEGWSRQRPDMPRKHWKLWLLKWFYCVSPQVATSFLLKAELSVWATRAHGDLNPGELCASASDKQWAVCCLYLIITVKNNSKPNKTLWNSFQDCRLYFKLALSWDDT